MMSDPGAALLSPDGLWQAWSFRPVVLLGLGASALAYAFGVRRLWRSAGTGHGIRPWRLACYGAGIVALGVALMSPLDALGDVLFWAHMVQHLVLMLVAAPLLVLGAPVVPSLWAFDAATRRRLGRWWNRVRAVPGVALITAPFVAWTLHVAAIWLWHLPAAYGAALDNEAIHVAEHLTFLGTAMLFWWVVFPPDGRHRLDRGLTILYLLAAGIQGGMLGALLTFAQTPLYPGQSAGAAAWGLTALQDQQVAGLIMWLPGGFVYVAVAGALFLAWLRPTSARRSPAGFSVIREWYV